MKQSKATNQNCVILWPTFQWLRKSNQSHWNEIIDMSSKSTYSAPFLLLFLFSLQDELHCSSIVTYKNSHHPPTLTETISFPDYLKCSIATIIILWWYILYWQAQTFLITKTLRNQYTIFFTFRCKFCRKQRHKLIMSHFSIHR